MKTENDAGQKQGVKFLKSGFVVMVLDFAAKCGHRLNSVVNA